MLEGLIFADLNNLYKERCCDNCRDGKEREIESLVTHTNKRTPRIYMVRILAYVHRQRWRNSTNQIWRYTSWCINILTHTQSPIHPIALSQSIVIIFSQSILRWECYSEALSYSINYIFGAYTLHYISIWSLTFQLCQFGL